MSPSSKAIATIDRSGEIARARTSSGSASISRTTRPRFHSSMRTTLRADAAIAPRDAALRSRRIAFTARASSSPSWSVANAVYSSRFRSSRRMGSSSPRAQNAERALSRDAANTSDPSMPNAVNASRRRNRFGDSKTSCRLNREFSNSTIPSSPAQRIQRPSGLTSKARTRSSVRWERPTEPLSRSTSEMPRFSSATNSALPSGENSRPTIRLRAGLIRRISRAASTSKTYTRPSSSPTARKRSLGAEGQRGGVLDIQFRVHVGLRSELRRDRTRGPPRQQPHRNARVQRSARRPSVVHPVPETSHLWCPCYRISPSRSCCF